MRQAFAIVFSLLLVLGQWAGATPSAPQRLADACDACDCKMVSCCITSAPAPSPNGPSVPASSVRVTEQQLVAAVQATVSLLDEPDRVSGVSLRCRPIDTASSAIPLYCWNCTLLI